MTEETLNKIKEKYEKLGEDPEVYLKGLLQAKPITYWDYIQVDSLLTLQKPRTDFKDEEVFITYHQIVELILKLILHEVKQMVEEPDVSEKFLMEKLDRVIHYTSMLITSFDVMKVGMNYDDYHTFRSTLTPASGFQSAQFRLIEIYCTPLENLVNEKGKERLPEDPTVDQFFDHLYWKDAGLNYETKESTLTLRLFEEKYLEEFILLAKKVQGNTLAERIAKMPHPSDALLKKLKQFDQIYNVDWPIVHLNTAQHYLDKKGENKAATGGSEWKKYLHPKYQQRKFFPQLYSEEEIKNWGQ